MKKEKQEVAKKLNLECENTLMSLLRSTRAARAAETSLMSLYFLIFLPPDMEEKKICTVPSEASERNSEV